MKIQHFYLLTAPTRKRLSHHGALFTRIYGDCTVQADQ